MSRPALAGFVKAYDVRGLVPDQLDAEVCTALGSAFAQVVVLPDNGVQVVLGHDMRASSPELAAAFARGLRSHGVLVTSVGLCSTDELYYASGVLGVPGAMVTASHNPAPYNGIKLCRSGARPVGVDSGLAEVRDLAQWLLDRADVHDLDAGAGPTPAAGDYDQEVDVLPGYVEHLHSLVDLAGGRPVRVVVDAGNGMAGHTVPPALDRPDLGLDLVPLYFELDGTFPNHPANPLDPETLRDLQREVVERGADLGLAFDGDADRCFVVDERGEPVSASTVTALVATREVARLVAAGTPADEVRVVHNAIVSRAVPEAIAEAGAVAVRARVGHSFVKATMAEHDAVFGGEHSGHYYFRDFWFADTGLLAALHVLAALKEQDGPLSGLVSRFDRYVASGELNSVVPDAPAAMARVLRWGREQEGVQVEEPDGLLLTHDDAPVWTVSVRSSNTEPLLRLNVEAADPTTMAQVRDEVLELLRVGTVEP